MRTVIYVVGLFKEGKLLEIYHARKLEESAIMDDYFKKMAERMESDTPKPPEEGLYYGFDKLLPKNS
jgi:hypothetical protein